jgi:hypothetical protein
MKRLFKIPRRRPHIVDFYTPLTQGLDQLGYRIAWAQNFDGSFTTIINSSNVGFLDPNVNRMKVETQPTTGTDVRIVFDPSSYTTALTGTYGVTSGSPSVTTSTSQLGLVYTGATVVFASQPGVQYTVEGISSTTFTLSANYTGPNAAATTATQGINDARSFWLQFSRIQGGTAILTSPPTLILPDYMNKGQGIVTIHGNAPAATSSATALQLDLPSLMQNVTIHSEDAANYLFVSTEQGGPEQQLGPATFYQYQTVLASQGSLWVRGANAAGSAGAIVAFSVTATSSFPR